MKTMPSAILILALSANVFAQTYDWNSSSDPRELQAQQETMQRHAELDRQRTESELRSLRSEVEDARSQASSDERHAPYQYPSSSSAYSDTYGR